MNALVPVPQYHPTLPTFLQDPKLFVDTDKTIAGIGGGSPPGISIRGGKFHVIGTDGEELHVNQLHLDVIVLTGNEHVSKTYYKGAYDPNAAVSAPNCFSDNGIGPSSQASEPQSANCASCAHNAWGSKITPNGTQIKACSDSKKLAVMLAVDTPVITNTNAAGVVARLDQVLLLRVPAASMRTWKDFAKDIRAKGIPMIGVVVRMTFDPQASYPALLFQAVGFIDEKTYNECKEAVEEAETIDMIGANDRPAAVSTAVAALPAAVPAHLTTPAPVAAPAPVAPAPAPVVAAPIAPAPVAAAPAPAAPAAAPAPRRRGRQPAAQTAAPAAAPAPVAPVPAPVAPAPVAAAPAPVFPAAAPAPVAAPAQGSSVIVQPAASDPSLDALLAAALK